MKYNRKKDSTVCEDRHGRAPGGRIASRRMTTAFACAATIAFAIVALANAGEVGAFTRWADDSEFGAPYPTEVAHPADLGTGSATTSVADGVLGVPELSYPLLAEGCGLVASITGLGESTYATPPQEEQEEQEDDKFPPEVTVPKRDNFGCALNVLPWVGGYRCRHEETCDLERKFTQSVTVTVGHVQRTETEVMCGYGSCGNLNIVAAQSQR